MNTRVRLGSATGPLGLRRQDMVAFCIWVAILVASLCVAHAETPADDFNPAALDSFFAAGSAKKADAVPATTPADTAVLQLASSDTEAVGEPAQSTPKLPAEFARHLVGYQEDQIRDGAVTLPIVAQVYYRHALAQITEGDDDGAIASLRTALAFAPHYSDAYFTIASWYAKRFSPESVYYFTEGFLSQLRSFDGQRRLVLNALASATLILLLASAIIWIALAVRYFPFIAHRIAESARIKFNAAGARVAAALLLLAPFALLPGYTTAAALILILTWPFMHKHERVLSMVMAGVLVVFAGTASYIDRLSVVADPKSLTSLIARANESADDPVLAHAIANCPIDDDELNDDRYTALGLLAMRGGDPETAAAHFLRAISYNKNSAIAYVNLGNVYFNNGQYTKALEGYRKAEEVDSTDAVGQYNLAQTYIKTLLMGESSQALSRASKLGLDRARDAIAEPSRARMSVYPRTYSSAQLWEIAAQDGAHGNPALVAGLLQTVTGHTAPVSAGIMLGAMLVALVLGRVIEARKLAFQCANCGDLTCHRCCSHDLGNVICRSCAEAVAGVSSDRVLDALLRQRRQSVIVRRRKSIRWATLWLPGLRHVHYGRLAAGFAVAVFFSTCVVMVLTRGAVFPSWDAIETKAPLWKWLVPAAGIAASYCVSLMSRRLYEARSTRTVPVRTHAEDRTTSQSA
ncbi:MAG TPA: tetratricopeptide repeat protein [Candidatus Krumholzibacteria bacterium]|nr:tetratricopeptide repeat protein [Candidatus Krumholzibacteria bacterium]